MVAMRVVSQASSDLLEAVVKDGCQEQIDRYDWTDNSRLIRERTDLSKPS